MKREDIYNIVLEAIDMSNHIREEGKEIPKAIDTKLYGTDGHLDSMGLVAFLIDVEELLLDEDIQIALSDERAMSQKNSPFNTVTSLVDYIETLLKDA